MHLFFENRNKGRSAAYEIITGSCGVRIRYGRIGAKLREMPSRSSGTFAYEAEIIREVRLLTDERRKKGYQEVKAFPALTYEGYVAGVNASFKTPVEHALINRVRRAIEKSGIDVDVKKVPLGLAFLNTVNVHNDPLRTPSVVVVPDNWTVHRHNNPPTESIVGEATCLVLLSFMKAVGHDNVVRMTIGSERSIEEIESDLAGYNCSAWSRFFHCMEVNSCAPVVVPVVTGTRSRDPLVL